MAELSSAKHPPYARAMKSVPKFTQERQLEHFKKAHPDYAARMANRLARTKAGDPKQVPVVK